MARNVFGRRTLLAGLGAGLTVPLLTSLRPRTARAATTMPRRLVIVYHPNGTNPDTWFPDNPMSEAAFDLKPVHEPLADFKSRLLLTRGIDMLSVEPGPGEPHQRGMGGMLSGNHLQEGTFVGGDGSKAGWGKGITLDQHIAAHLAEPAQRPSLELGVRVVGSEVRHRMSYAGPAQPLPPVTDPSALYSSLFADLMVPPDKMAATRDRRRSVLDAAARQFTSVRARVSNADRQKLDQHRAMLRSMEEQLERFTSLGGACQAPPAPAPLEDPEGEESMHLVSRLMMDMAVMSLACDMTRVVTLQYSSSANNIRFPWLESFSDDHFLSHAGPSDTTSQGEWEMRQKWYAGELAHLLRRLDDVDEEDGTLLDNTLVLWCSELGQGNIHSHQDVPFVLAGGTNLGLKTGRYVRYQNASHNDLLIAIMNAFGVTGDTFGDPDFCSGPLAGLF